MLTHTFVSTICPHSRIAPQRTFVVTAATHLLSPTSWNLSSPVSSTSGAAPSTPGARGARQWAHKTLYYGDRLFTANDRESSRIARISSGMRDRKIRCLAVENEQKADPAAPLLGNLWAAASSPARPTA